MNFDKENFSKILTEIKNSYGSINKMAEKMEITAAYISKLIRNMYDNAPSPEILKKISDNSNGLVTYENLMEVCGYLDNEYIRKYFIHNYNVSNTTFEKALGNNIFDGLNEKESEVLAQIIKDYHKKNISFDKNKYLSDLNFESKSKVVNKYNEMLKAQLDILSSVKKTTKALQEINDSESISEKAKTLNNYSNSNFYRCPVYGKISAGLPNWAEECLEGYLPIDPNLMGIINPEECFFLRVDR